MQSTSLFVTTESDKESIKERSRALFPYDDDRRDYIYLDDKRVVAWGQDSAPALFIFSMEKSKSSYTTMSS